MSSRRADIWRSVWCVAFCAISACAPHVDTAVYRDTTVPMGATTRFDPSRFAGDWSVVARFDAAPFGTVGFDVVRAQKTMRITSDALSDYAGLYQITGTGILNNPADDITLVVMWVDEGFRTAAIGTASGKFAVILDRQEEAPADRMNAARSVLEFYGWDISQLKGTAP